MLGKPRKSNLPALINLKKKLVIEVIKEIMTEWPNGVINLNYNFKLLKNATTQAALVALKVINELICIFVIKRSGKLLIDIFKVFWKTF